MKILHIIRKYNTKMSCSFEIDNYTIVTSLNERTIYIKVMDTITFMCYESNVDSKELRLSIELCDSYKLMNKCFQKEDGYNINIVVNSGIMKLLFSAVVEGYLRINFEIMLREKIMANDGQLTLNFNRIEQKQAQAIDALTQRLNQLEGLIDALSYAEIYMLGIGYTQNNNSSQLYWKLNTIELNLISNFWNYTKIHLFYQLKKLTFTSTTDLTNFKNQNVSNKTVTELIMNNISSLGTLTGLDNFPKLEKLTLTSCAMSDIVTVLKGYKHKVKHIIIQRCGSINNTELMTYCQANNIKLELS